VLSLFLWGYALTHANSVGICGEQAWRPAFVFLGDDSDFGPDRLDGYRLVGFCSQDKADPTKYGLLLFATGVLLSIGFSAYMAYPMGVTTKLVTMCSGFATIRTKRS